MAVLMATRSLLDAKPGTPELRDWLTRVDKIAPIIEAHRDAAERNRVTSPEVFEALREAGISRMWVSRDLGGSRLSIETGSAVIRRLAALDPSIAWQMGVQGAIGRLSDYLPEPVAGKLFKESAALVVGGVNPAGRAVPVPGGYLLSGTWGFASGSVDAEWLVCAAPVVASEPDGEQPRPPRIRMLFIPKSEVTMLDTWYTVGLRGTGSNDYEVPEIFVPHEFTVDQAAMYRAPADRPSRAYPISYYDFGPFTSASTALGVAQGAVAAVKELAGKRPTAGSGSLAGSHTAQDRLARAESLVRAAELVLADAAWHVQRHGLDGGDGLSALVRLAAATVAENATAAVDIAYRIAGSSSLYARSPLERYFRDVNSAVKHITLSHTHFEMVGQYLFGGDLQMRR